MKRLAVLAAVQLGAILGWAGYHEHVRAHSPTFRIPLQPIDPYDALRGRYFVLNPVDGRLLAGAPGTYLGPDSVSRFLGAREHYAGPAAVGFCRVGEVHRVCDLQPLETALAGDPSRFWSRVRVSIFREPATRQAHALAPQPGWRVDLDLELDRFFLPARLTLPGPERDPGWELEVSHRPGQPLLPRQLWFRGRALETDRP
jgi:hypothetical protein